jgi:hypothetical protein
MDTTNRRLIFTPLDPDEAARRWYYVRNGTPGLPAWVRELTDRHETCEHGVTWWWCPCCRETRAISGTAECPHMAAALANIMGSGSFGALVNDSQVDWVES